jgi:hypothetical protein
MLPTKHKSNWRTSLHAEPEKVRTIIKEKNQTGEPPYKLNHAEAGQGAYDSQRKTDMNANIFKANDCPVNL